MGEPKTGDARALRSPKKVRKALQLVVGLMRREFPEAVYFAHAGTALAIQYGGGDPERTQILPGDRDIDFGIFAETIFVGDLIREAWKSGLSLGYYFDSYGFYPRVPFRRVMEKAIGVVICLGLNEVPMDFYFMYPHEGGRWWMAGGPTYHCLPEEVILPLKERKFYGVKLPTPEDLERYCDAMWKKKGDRYPEPADPRTKPHVRKTWPIK